MPTPGMAPASGSTFGSASATGSSAEPGAARPADPGRVVATTDAAAAAAPDGDWELLRQWRRAVRAAKWAVGVVLGVLALLVVIEAARYFDFFVRIHWTLGVAYVVALVAFFAVLIGLPTWRYLRIPAVMQPPAVDLRDGRATHEELVRHARFLSRYCRSLSRNPELAEQRAQITQTAADAAGLYRRARSAHADDLAGLLGEIRAFERDRVEPLLQALDARVDAYIRKEAVSVGIGTAVSLNGTLDAFIVLWRSANMVSRIARFYYGRPGLRGSLLILRDVVGAMVVSRAMDPLSDKAGDLAGGVLGRLGGIVAGPVMDGAINALMTMKVGHLAKRRCRSFQAWNEKTMRRVVMDVLTRVKTESTGIVGELLTRLGRFGTRAAAAAATVAATAATAGGRTAWNLLRSLFGVNGEKAAQGAAAEADARASA
jgi:putative membrane protein